MFRGMPKEQIREFVIYGTEEDVLREIISLEDAGIQYFIVDLDHRENLNN